MNHSLSIALRIYGRNACALLSVTALSCGGATSQSTCTVSVSNTQVDSTFNTSFTQNGPGQYQEPTGKPGWNGADSTYSIVIPGTTNSAFFFSDSYIGQSPAKSGDGTVTTSSSGLRTRVANCNPPLCSPATNLYRAHNSIVIRNSSGTTMNTITGPLSSGYSTSYFNPTNTNHFYWMGDSVAVQVDSSGTQKIWTMLLEFDASWNYYGSAIAQLSVPNLTIDSITPLTNVPTGNTINWGSAMWLDGSYGNYYLYIYGVNGKQPYVALTNPALGVSGIANTNNWYVSNSSRSWVTGLNNAAPIIGASTDPNTAGDLISNEYSVKKVSSNAGTTYLLVTEDNKPAYGTQNSIVLYSACSPQGPFSVKNSVYLTPETGATTVPGMTGSQKLNGQLLTYNPHAHPQFNTNNELLISYDLNSTNSGDLLYADSYRPKFIRVTISGLK